MARIFVSYRRQDSPYVADTLKNRLEQRFGGGSVFFDIDNIPFGANFKKHIEHAVAQCAAMLVLIGDKWLAHAETADKNRLFDPRDYVRMEIEAALGRGIPVVPVLVDSAGMPAAEDLPESIQELIFHNAAEVRAGRDLETHITRLVDGLWREIEPDSTTASKSSPPAARTKQPPAQPAANAKSPAGKETLRKQDVKNRKAHPERNLPRRAGGGLPQSLHPSFLRRAFKDTQTYVGSAIPRNKLHNAVSAYAIYSLDAKDVLALYDDTLFGGAKDGFLLATEEILWRNLGDTPHTLSWSDLKRVGRSPSGVKVNGDAISISDGPSAEALVYLLKEMIKSRS
jgi:hypothetical protein